MNKGFFSVLTFIVAMLVQGCNAWHKECHWSHNLVTM